MENSEETLLYAIEEQERKTGTTIIKRKSKKNQEVVK
jgi:transcriptional regulator, GntR family